MCVCAWVCVHDSADIAARREAADVTRGGGCGEACQGDAVSHQKARACILYTFTTISYSKSCVVPLSQVLFIILLFLHSRFFMCHTCRFYMLRGSARLRLRYLIKKDARTCMSLYIHFALCAFCHLMQRNVHTYVHAF